jgi:RNA polymerase sigma-70 factor (ECF subfamily)
VVASDLYLACACLSGRADAIAAFEREHMPAVRAAVASLDRGRGLTDEVEQQIRTLLLVDDAGRGPALAHYAGRGALRKFVRVVAVREAWRLRKPEKREVGIDDQGLLDALTPPGDPALSAIKRDAADKVRAAFLAAFGDLPRRERAALRMSFIDGLTIDEIAPVFQVHRATIARWIQAARDSVLAATRRRLVKDHGLDPSEVDSILRLAQSRIDLTVDQLMKTGTGSPG